MWKASRQARSDAPASMPSAANCWKSQMSTKSSFRAALERPATPKEEPLVRSGSPVRLVLRFDDVEKPVTVARVLTRHGVSLRKAHEILNRLAEGETVAVELFADDARGLVSEFSAL